MVFNYFTAMIGKPKKLIIVVLLAAAILIKLVSNFPVFIERYYSNGIYPFISKLLKFLLGWLPISLGDLLYIAAIIWLLFKLIRMFIALVKKQVNWPVFSKFLLSAITIWLGIYVLFNALWGLNYNRRGIASQLGISTQPYSRDELLQVDTLLLEKVNSYKMAMIRNPGTVNQANTFPRASKAYQQIVSLYPFLEYSPTSIKPSLFGSIGNYIGFTGYYNPFTGEAQLNTTVPGFLQPFTTCHEIAHQLGYAKENEANFVGYLAASNAPDTAFRYSVYLDLYLYAQRNLYNADSTAAREVSKKMLPEVKDDLLFLRQFYERHRNPLEPFFRWIYGKYLESNQQPSGLLTYDEVTGFLVAFHKKFGKL